MTVLSSILTIEKFERKFSPHTYVLFAESVKSKKEKELEALMLEEQKLKRNKYAAPKIGKLSRSSFFKFCWCGVKYCHTIYQDSHYIL